VAVHEQSIVVDAPVHEVFLMWRNLEDFPKFMSHAKQVKMLGEDRSRWRGEVAGIDEEWDARTTRMEEDKSIAWESVSGFENSGEIRFDRQDGGTRITVRFEYEPPAGLIGDAAEAIYVGRQFDEALEADLQRFKKRVETSKSD
jgi:uncharacterized membrane protein